jgi:hypothetical protein
MWSDPPCSSGSPVIIIIVYNWYSFKYLALKGIIKDLIAEWIPQTTMWFLTSGSFSNEA